MTKTAYRLSELPVGRTKAYEEIHSGRLRAVKCGKVTLVLAEDYDRWIKSLPALLAERPPSKTQITDEGRRHA